MRRIRSELMVEIAVLSTGLWLRREAVINEKTRDELLLLTRILDALQDRPIAVTRVLTDEVQRVVERRARAVAVDLQHGHKRAGRNPSLGVHKGNALEQQVPGPHLDVEPLVPKLREVGAKTYQLL